MGKIRSFFQKYSSNRMRSENLLSWILFRRWILFIVLISISFFLILLVSNVRTINAMLVENRKLELSIIELKDRNARLYSRIVELESAERVIPIAETMLGMYLPEETPIIINR